MACGIQKRGAVNRNKVVAISYVIAKANKNEPLIRFVFSYLWFATGLLTMQCIVCTLRVLLHAVQLAQRFASKLARLCYYARFTRYKSCCPHHQKALKTQCFQGFCFLFSVVTRRSGIHRLSILVHFQNADMAVGLLFLSLTNLISLLIILAVNSCVHFLYAPLPKQIL